MDISHLGAGRLPTRSMSLKKLPAITRRKERTHSTNSTPKKGRFGAEVGELDDCEERKQESPPRQAISRKQMFETLSNCEFLDLGSCAFRSRRVEFSILPSTPALPGVLEQGPMPIPAISFFFPPTFQGPGPDVWR